MPGRQRNWTGAECATLRALWAKLAHFGPAKRALIIGEKLKRSWGAVYHKAEYEGLHTPASVLDGRRKTRHHCHIQKWWNDTVLRKGE